MSFRNRDKLVADSNNKVLANFFFAALERSQENIREVCHRKNRSYKNIIAAANDGVAYKYLYPAMENAFAYALDAAVGTDTNNSNNRLKEEAVRQVIKSCATTP